MQRPFWRRRKGGIAMIEGKCCGTCKWRRPECGGGLLCGNRDSDSNYDFVNREDVCPYWEAERGAENGCYFWR